MSLLENVEIESQPSPLRLFINILSNIAILISISHLIYKIYQLLSPLQVIKEFNANFKLTYPSRTRAVVAFRSNPIQYTNFFNELAIGVDTLELSINYQFDDAQDLITFLKLIPPHILHLRFIHRGWTKDNFLAFGEEELTKIYQAIPRHLHSFSLDGFDLSNMDISQLIVELPLTLKHLKLEECELNSEKLSEILYILSATLNPLRSLQLRGNPNIFPFASRKPQVLLATDLQLDMSDTHFMLDTHASRRGAFLTALPREVISLDFRKSNFFDELNHGIKLPKQLIELGINADVLINEKRMIQDLPKLKSLKLSFSSCTWSNGDIYTYIPDAQIISQLNTNLLRKKYYIFACIPSTVDTLDLSHNDLGSLNEVELLSMLRHLPLQLRVIILDNNSLFHTENTMAEADALFEKIIQALPAHPVYGKPTVHLNIGNGYSCSSQFGLLLTPKDPNSPKEKLHHLPCDARHQVYKFLGGRGALVDIEPCLKPKV